MVAVAQNHTPPEISVSLKTHTPLLNMQVSGLRYYSPELGRWVSRDPIREQGGIHLYVVCRNDPVNIIDPLGLEPTPTEIIVDILLDIWGDEIAEWIYDFLDLAIALS